MRSSLSCDACRRSKIKCVNTGAAPCARCDRSSIPGCLLTRPRHPGAKSRRNNGHRTSACNPAALQASPRGHSVQVSSPDTPDRTHDLARRSSAVRVDSHISSLPRKYMLRAIYVFINKFLELPFLHVAIVMRNPESAPYSPELKALLGAVLAIIRLQPEVSHAVWADELLPQIEYAEYARDALSRAMLGPPKIEVVQALLVMALHDWGFKSFHKAWVYCGIAIRIMQAIHSSRVAPYPLEPSTNSSCDSLDDITLMIETRTYWACFIMDCMINSGTYNPPMLPISEVNRLRVGPPPSVLEYTLGSDTKTSTCTHCHSPALLNITQRVDLLTGGFGIWAQIMSFVFNDGRKAAGMCAPQNCPWVAGSPWSKSWSSLKEWRARQHPSMHYPKSSVAAHMMAGYGETYTYINLLYFVSVIVLHREYIPFLPGLDTVPAGPVDHPLLEAEAPAGWWEDSAAEIFGAAEHVALLLKDASEAGVAVVTPFAGFCAFSAGFMCVYVRWFPRMNLGRSPAAQECLDLCLGYLDEFRHVWSIADGWIKTIQHASVLYNRAATMDCYRGKSRANFNTLHQSMNEFRAVDRSSQQSVEIEGVAPVATNPEPTSDVLLEGEVGADISDSGILLNQFLADVGGNLNEQGPWSHWWPWTEDAHPL